MESDPWEPLLCGRLNHLSVEVVNCGHIADKYLLGQDVNGEILKNLAGAHFYAARAIYAAGGLRALTRFAIETYTISPYVIPGWTSGRITTYLEQLLALNEERP